MQARQRRFLIGLMIATILVRGGVLIAQKQRLNDDLDAYRGIAEQLAQGKGYSLPNTDEPTAFRPPLYPLLLAVIFKLDAGNAGIAVLHLLLGVGTVLFIWRLAQRLFSQATASAETSFPAALLAACLIGFDPLLIQYSTLPMTETLCAYLAVWALYLMVPLPASRTKQFSLGLVLGLCVLSRPTFLIFSGLAFVVWSGWNWKMHGLKSLPWAMPLGVLFVVSPWMIRNAVVFGTPRVTTTHGGYTLLLGNNPVFYREVVSAPWGTVWEGESLARWQRSLETEMEHADPPVETEEQRDRWMYDKARGHIGNNPGLFLRASLLRFLRFWNVIPPPTALDAIKTMWERGCSRAGLESWKAAAGAVTRLVAAAVGLFYGVLILSFVVGLCRLHRQEWPTWWPMVLLVASFCAVHLVYWSNTRMRAPVMPAVVLVAVRAWVSIWAGGERRHPKDPDL